MQVWFLFSAHHSNFPSEHLQCFTASFFFPIPTALHPSFNSNANNNNSSNSSSSSSNLLESVAGFNSLPPQDKLSRFVEHL